MVLFRIGCFHHWLITLVVARAVVLIIFSKENGKAILDIAFTTIQCEIRICLSLHSWYVLVTIVLAYLTGGGSLVVYGSGVVHKSCELAFGR